MSNAKPAATAPASQAGRSSMTSGTSHGGQSAVPHDRIANRAYEKWCKRGCPHGTHELDWYEAEAELRAEMTGQTVGRATPSSGPQMQQPVSARPTQAAPSMPAKPAQRR